MKKEDLRILFMGTPEFAVKSLKALVENNYNVVAVITMPDKPAGRGYKLQASPVKQYAIEKGLTVLQPENLKDESFLVQLKELRIDLQVVVAFRMLPEVVWSMPSKGTFNLHSSILPQYRGAAPINWAIINGEKETGVTTFFLSHEIDTGDIIFREKTTITNSDNAETLHDRLMVMGAQLVLKTVNAVIEGSVTSIPQDELYANKIELKPAPKIFKDDCRVNWNKDTEVIFNFIRGLSPYPAAWTELHRPETDEVLRVKLFASMLSEEVDSEDLKNGATTQDNEATTLENGSITTDNKSYLNVLTANGFLAITDLQLSGKKRMNVIDFLNGYKLREGDYFE
ncbi:MAG TPA: methionyl-tRNA formyltransferase [Bacteroidales bacterium]|nr:methionyl-tRNA formyltransferase [Bacteroidales bacterium]